MESKSRGVLDTPQEPVIGLAEGETRWRGMRDVITPTRHSGAARRLSPESITPIVRMDSGLALSRARNDKG
jgi:hypothetical protein